MTTTSNASATTSERAAKGREARAWVPRSGHAQFEPVKDRLDPVDLLESQSATRVPELIPIRYGRMLESPFRFYRGAAAIMAMDLGSLPHTGIRAQLCGDAHLLNFRLLASPERQLIFDINDFDETLPGPWEWDLKRLTTSLVIAGRENEFSAQDRDAAVQSCVRGYRERMHEFAGMRVLDIWYAQDKADELIAIQAKKLGGHARRRASAATAKARTRTGIQAFDKLTQVTDGVRQITADPPLITPIRDILPGTPDAAVEQGLRELVSGYAKSLSSEHQHLLGRYQVIDMARKVVGVGSVGTRCWIILLRGRDDQDPLLLQAKEAGESVLAPHSGASRYRNQGRRVVSGQRLMQAASDIFLGWETVTGIDGRQRDFYVRQLRDWKGIARPETMEPKTLAVFGRLCGGSLARAHARSGDPIAINAYLGAGDSFSRALVEFAETYADQNERDYRALVEAANDGRITARTA